MLKAGNENPQLFTDLASCIEIETHDFYDDFTYENRSMIERTINGQCLEQHIESLGVSAYDVFLIKKILDGTDGSVTEAKLTAGFSDPNMMIEYNANLNNWDSLAGLVAKIILLLKGYVFTKAREVPFHTI